MNRKIEQFDDCTLIWVNKMGGHFLDTVRQRLIILFMQISDGIALFILEVYIYLLMFE